MAQDEQGGDSFLTVAEVAELLKLNQQTVRNWIDQGSMPAFRIGRRVRIKQSDLDRVLAMGYQGAPALRDPDLSGPSAEDFWSGEQVGTAELATSNDRDVADTADVADVADVADTADTADTAVTTTAPVNGEE